MNKKVVGGVGAILGALFLMILACVILFARRSCWYTRHPQEPHIQGVQVVVARYAEDIQWLGDLPFDDIVVYNKGPALDPDTLPQNVTEMIQLPNVGRDCHTYLHHCYTRYDSMADVTLFLPASVPDFPDKKDILKNVVDILRKRKNSTFPCWQTEVPLHEEVGDFELDEWVAHGHANAKLNPNAELDPSPERPFSAWYAKNFPDVSINRICMRCIFALHRDHCHNRPKEFYKNLISYLDKHSNSEVCHYLERAWAAVFHVIPEDAYTDHAD